MAAVEDMPMPPPPLPGGRSAVVAARERTPGTPSRKEKTRESSAVQDPGLKDYVRATGTPRRGLLASIDPACSITDAMSRGWGNALAKVPSVLFTRRSTGAQVRRLL